MVAARPVPAEPLRDSLFAESTRVTMGDVDAAGILYFAAPYRWLEHAFTGWLNQVGHSLSAQLREGFGCPCVTSATWYGLPLMLDDEIELRLLPSTVGRTSFSVTMEAARAVSGAVAIRSTAWHVWSSLDGPLEARVVTPLPMPEWLRRELAEAPLTHPVQTDEEARLPDDPDHHH